MMENKSSNWIIIASLYNILINFFIFLILL